MNKFTISHYKNNIIKNTSEKQKPIKIVIKEVESGKNYCYYTINEFSTKSCNVQRL